MKRSRGAVACGHAGTAAAALDVLRAGGNAVDAAIAAFFCACVYEPVLASLGGGGFAMCRFDGRPTRVLDFFTQTPITRRPPDELDFESVVVDFGDATQEFHIGLGAVATPGAVKGMFELHREYGSIPLSQLAAPAVDAIREKPALCELQAHILKVVEPIYTRRDSARTIYESRRQPGRVRSAGECLDFREFGAFLDTLVREGEDMFYHGEVASLIESQCRSFGGSLARPDMEGYRVHWRTPLVSDYRDTRISLNPPPSAGGVLVLFALAVLDRLPALVDERRYYALLAEAMDLSDDAWLKTKGAQCPPAVLKSLIDDELLSSCAADLRERARGWRGTTHISVADGDGGMVGLTVTNGEGCGEITPGTGIMFNNMLGEENLNPAGFHRWRPDSRMSSMMAPTLLEWRDGRRAMIGSGGSNRIRTAILQSVVQLVDRALSPQDAVDCPRIHVEDGLLSIEGGVDESVLAALVGRFARHCVFKDRNFFFGGVHNVSVDGGAFDGAGDPRRAGVFFTV